MPPVEIGVSLADGALACIVAQDGTVRFDAHGSTLNTSFTAAPARMATEILVRVTDKSVACVVNGQTALTISPPSVLKGAPGIYVGASGLVLVAGFTVETLPNQTGGR
jgi:hypothetical protein